jgi:hypothetical protein
MKSLKLLTGSTAAMLVAGGSALVAQQLTGTLSGRVTDTSGMPLAEVTIRLESPALFQPRVVKTNDKGEWRAPLLAVGDYTLHLSKSGYLGKTASNMRVGVSTSPRLDLQLKVIEIAAKVVEVVESAALISKAETQTSVNYSGEQLAKLPFNTSNSSVFEVVQEMAPGSTNGYHGVRGSGAQGTALLVDGIDVKDSATNSALYQPMQDNIEDTQMVLSSVNARHGRVLGGQVKVVTKTGGNDFAGSIRANYSRTSWTANRFRAVAEDVANAGPDLSERSFDVTTSGPIWKDHIWFSLGTRLRPVSGSLDTLYGPWAPGPYLPLSPQPNYVPGYPFPQFEENYGLVAQKLYEGPGNGYQVTPLMDAEGVVQGTTKNKKYEGKITATLGTNHVLTMSHLYDRNTYTGYADQTASFSRYNKEFYGPCTNTNKATTLNWRGILAPNLLVEANVFYASVSKMLYPGPTDKPVSVYAGFDCSGWGVYLPYGGPIPIMREKSSTSPEKHSTASQSINFQTYQDWLGSHEIDFGFENIRLGFNSGAASGLAADRVLVGGWYRKGTTGDDFLFPTLKFMGEMYNAQDQGPWINGMSNYGSIAMGPAPVLIQSWAAPGENLNYTRAFYLNDNWAVNRHWSVNLGLRYSRFSINNIDGSNMASYSFFEPRLQVKFDPAGDGRNVVNVTMSRYSQEFTTGLSQAFITDPEGVYTLAGWKGLPGQLEPGNPADPSYGVRFVDYNTLVDHANYGDPYKYNDVRQTQQLRNLKVPYCDEIALNYHKSFEGGFLGLSLVQRDYKRDNMVSRDFGFENFRLIQDPSGRGAAPLWQQLTTYTNSPWKRTYSSAEFSWQQAVTSRLDWGGSVTVEQTAGPSTTAAGAYPSLRNDERYGLTQAEKQPSGLLSRGQKIRSYWTYHHPVGQGGELGFTLLASYIEGMANSSALQGLGVVARFADANGNSPTMPGVDANGYVVQTIYPRYAKSYSGMGAYKMSQDAYSLSLKVNWSVPLGLGKTRFVGSFAVTGILNNVVRINDPYFGEQAWYGPGVVDGRYMLTFANQPGAYLNTDSRMDKYNYDSGNVRRVSEFTAGIRF